MRGGRGIGGHARPCGGWSDIWLTPPDILMALGEFDLDPCALPEPRPWETARNCISPPDHGMREPWKGRVWLNAPYSGVSNWLGKLADHGNGTAITFARTETKWFLDCVWMCSNAVLFLHGRPHFHYPNGKRAAGNCGGPICLIAYGKADAKILRESFLAGTFIDLRNSAAIAHIGQWPQHPSLFDD